MVGTIDRFKKQLQTLIIDLDVLKIEMFLSMSQISSRVSYDPSDFENYRNIINNLIAEYDKRFKDIDSIRTCLLFYNPLHCDIKEFCTDIRIELCYLQSDPNLLYSIEVGINFWKKVEKIKYPIVVNQILKISSMFGSSYMYVKKDFH